MDHECITALHFVTGDHPYSRRIYSFQIIYGRVIADNIPADQSIFKNNIFLRIVGSHSETITLLSLWCRCPDAHFLSDAPAYKFFWEPQHGWTHHVPVTLHTTNSFAVTCQLLMTMSIQKTGRLSIELSFWGSHWRRCLTLIGCCEIALQFSRVSQGRRNRPLRGLREFKHGSYLRLMILSTHKLYYQNYQNSSLTPFLFPLVITTNSQSSLLLNRYRRF
jgi:hypothetical protein